MDFRRSPAVFGPVWKLHAQVYYTEEMLGILYKTHRPFYDAIHAETAGDHKRDALNSIDKINDFFEKFGIPANKFNSTFQSFVVLGKVERAEQRGRDYKIESVPTIIVNGKYKVTAGKHTF